MPAAIGVETQNRRRQPIEQIPIVRDQHDGSGKLQQALFEHFQRRDIKVVRRFVGQQDIGRFEHQVGNEDSRLLAPRQPAHGRIELLNAKQKPLSPSRDMHRLAAEIDRLALRAERFAQRLRAIQMLAILIEPHHRQIAGLLDRAAAGVAIGR